MTLRDFVFIPSLWKDIIGKYRNVGTMYLTKIVQIAGPILTILVTADKTGVEENVDIVEDMEKWRLHRKSKCEENGVRKLT